MEFLKRLFAEFTIRTEQPFVMRSQLKALAKQLPLLYATLCTNAIAVVCTHFGSAPAVLTLWVPIALVPFCALRVIAWRALVIDDLKDDQVVHQLRRTMVLVAVLGLSFTIWSIALLPYGNDYAKVHVAFFMSITVVGCIFCLIHLRAAALTLMTIVIVPFTVRLVSSGEPVLVAIAINFLIVSIVMSFMLLAYYEDFRRLVHSTEALAQLSEDHRQAAHVDSLTGLANRRQFFGDLAAAIEQHTQTGEHFALGLIDLDGFKPVNDIHGHQYGDHVLVEISRRLEASLDGAVRIARLGGDEFAIIVPRRGADADLDAIGRLVCAAVARPIALPNTTVKVAASIGFAVFPVMGRSQASLIERADFALYHAKDRCRGTAVIFTQDHATAIRERLQLDQQLRRADLDAEMSVAFQAVMDTRTSEIVGFEALARWTSPVLGVVSPAAFIPAAERAGLVGELTALLFAKACAAAEAWPATIGLSFNLSVDDLMSEDSAARLTAMVRQCRLAPRRLTFEITETAIMRDFDRACTTLQALQALGCRIALDDFGTGYSSLSYVHRLPLDKLKIDQSFVRSLATDRTSLSIIRSIVDLSATLTIGCIVEGVETSEQAAILRSIGCTVMQGYHFGRPLPAEAAAATLATRRHQGGRSELAA